MTTSARRASPPVPAITAELTILENIGTAWTKASVVGRAGGRWRIVTQAAQPSAWGEDALLDALSQRLRPLVDPRLVADLAGIVRDATRIVCRSPRRPARLVVVSVGVAAPAVAALTADAEAAGWQVAARLPADDRRPIPERLHDLTDVDPDAWLLVTGPRPGGRDALPETLAVVTAARAGGRAPVLWCGPGEQQPQVERMFERGVVIVLADAAGVIADALSRLFRELSEVDDLRHLAPVAFGRAVRSLARSTGLEVAGVDIGATWTAWASADRWGMGVGGFRALEPADAAPIGNPVDESSAADGVLNQRARPGSLPETSDEMRVAQALVSDAVAQTRGTEAPAVDLVIGAGRGLGATPHPADAAQALLDGLRPSGISQLAVDASDVLAPLGSLPERDMEEAIEVLHDDLLVPLGSAVVSRGGRSGQIAMRAWVRRPGWPAIGPVGVRVGGLQTMPLPRGATAEIEVELEPGVQLGTASRERRWRATVTGGPLGVILDARDDPIRLPEREADQRLVLAGWRDALRHESRVVA